MNKAIGVIVLGIAMFIILIIVLVSMKDGKEQKYYEEQKIELSRVERKLTELTFDIKLRSNSLQINDDKLSKSTSDIDRFNKSVVELEEMYDDYLETLKLYNRISDEIKENLDAKGMYCDFCKRKESEYNFTFE